MQVAGLGLQVFFQFPLAIVAIKIGRRQAGQQQARLAQTLEDALPPVLDAVNLPPIEEGHSSRLASKANSSLI